MLGGLTNLSAALTLFTRIDVPTNQTRFPVISALPTAYFVNGDTGQKQTTEAAWTNKYIDIQELAAIVPIPDAVLHDASYDIFGAIRPLVENAIARSLDAAIFFGVNKPGPWPLDIASAAATAANTVTRGTATQAQGGVVEDINQLNGTLLADGYVPTAYVANPSFQVRLRSARSTQGQPLVDVNGTVNQIWGLPTTYPMIGLWPSGPAIAELFALQRENFVIGVNQDFTVTASNTAVIQDAAGVVQFNAFQQDMTMYRIVFRVGWQVSNPINYAQAVEANRFPAGVLVTP